MTKAFNLDKQKIRIRIVNLRQSFLKNYFYCLFRLKKGIDFSFGVLYYCNSFILFVERETAITKPLT